MKSSIKPAVSGPGVDATIRTSVIEAFGTRFRNPILLAAGTAGFGREVAGVVDLGAIGGIITKAVSVEVREGNAAPRVAEFSGGMLNSVGLANPGLAAVSEQELPWLADHAAGARVIVNVVGDTPDDYVAVVEGLTGFAVIDAFELNVSCPNTERGGEEFGADPAVLADLVRRTADATPKPVIAKLSPTLPDLVGTAGVALAAGAAGLSLVNTIPGFLFDEAESGRARLGRGQGGVSGPPLLPVGILAVKRVVEATGATVIGIGGIRTEADVNQYLEAGATLVAVGTAALADPRVPARLGRRWMARA